MIHKISSYLIISLLTVFMSCSLTVNTADGTDSETTNGIVALINEDGSKATNTSVTLVPINYNPVKDGALPDSLTKTTDAEGECIFLLQDSCIYNIHAIHQINRTQTLITNVQSQNTSTSLFIKGTLLKTGVINILVSDTVDTISTYLYFKSTTIHKSLSEGFSPIGGYYKITFDSIPSNVDLPTLIFSKNREIEIITSLLIDTLKPVSIGFKDNTIKPVWRFSLTVAVKDVVLEFYNGFDNIKPLIVKQINESTAKFNKTDHFEAIFHFAMDSLYEFTSDVFTEGRKPIGRFDYRLLYSNNQDNINKIEESLDNIYRTSYIYLYSNPINFFKDWDRDILSGLLAQTRGCLELDWLIIDSTQNPINNTGYAGITSMLNDPEGTDHWDKYSINILNFNKDNIKQETDILHKAFPQQIGVIVKSRYGETISGAKINVYTGKFNTRSIIETPLLTGGITDNNGKYLFTDNPFKPNGSAQAKNGIALIQVVNETDTTYTWLPMNEVGNTYFSNPVTTLYKEIRF